MLVTWSSMSKTGRRFSTWRRAVARPHYPRHPTAQYRRLVSALRLKQGPDTASIPVVITTISEDGERAKELGADQYLRKPFSNRYPFWLVSRILANTLRNEPGIKRDMEDNKEPHCEYPICLKMKVLDAELVQRYMQTTSIIWS